MTDDERTIIVCAACLRACCWQGIFYCEDADVADITEKTIAQLRELDLEHSDYWREEMQA